MRAVLLRSGTTRPRHFQHRHTPLTLLFHSFLRPNLLIHYTQCTACEVPCVAEGLWVMHIERIAAINLFASMVGELADVLHRESMQRLCGTRLVLQAAIQPLLQADQVLARRGIPVQTERGVGVPVRNILRCCPPLLYSTAQAQPLLLEFLSTLHMHESYKLCHSLCAGG